MFNRKMAIMESLVKKVDFWYYQYLLHTALYMLNPTERKVFSILFNRFTVVVDRPASMPGYLSLYQWN